MVDIKNKGYTSPIAVHPGETIQETLDFTGMPQSELATRTELSEKTISLILNGHQPITPETALKFERVLGLSKKMLLALQAYYEADKFRLEEKEKLEKETSELSRYECYNELAKFGFVQSTKNPIKKVEELLKFFGINSLNSMRTVFPVAFRRNQATQISYEALAAWLRMGVLQAQQKEVAEFDKDLLLKNIQKMRALTREPVEVYSQALIELCAEAGVTLVYTPHLKKTCVNGASQWISPDKALVQVSLYYAYADIFWFTLFHELGHILKHSKKETFIEFENSVNKEPSDLEKEADLFAQRVLIPIEKEKDYQSIKIGMSGINCKERIAAFANSIELDSGIVAGRIGREMSAWRYVSSLRKKLRFSDQ